MNTMTAERPPAKAPRMRYPEQALAELKSEDPNTPVTVYMIRRLVAAGTIPSIRMGRRRLLNYDSLARPALIGAAVFETPEIGVHRNFACVQSERKDFVRHGEIAFVTELIHGVSSCSLG